MKACKFCGTQVDSAVRNCPTCGSNTFLHICENCGSQFDSGFCPNCGVKAGAVKKICPDCHTAYYTPACPNCGYTPARKPVVQEIVHKHIYEEKPAEQPEPVIPSTQANQAGKKNKGCGCVTLLLVIVLIGGFIATRSTIKKTTTTTTTIRTTAATTVKSTGPTATPKPTATPDPEIARVQAAVDTYLQEHQEETPATDHTEPKGIDALIRAVQDRANGVRTKITVYHSPYKNGRGQVDTVGYEPDYIGVIGFAAVSENQNLEKSSTFSATPWMIPVYRKDKQFWEETGTVDHKTKVVVIDQELEKPRTSSKYSVWKGYLHVIRLDDLTDCYIDVTNFVAKDYWNEELSKALGKGCLIAEFKQVSDFYPVSKGKEKVALEDGFKVLIPQSTTSPTSPDKTNNPIPACVFQEWKYGFGGVVVFFNEQDLTLIY